MRTEDILCRTVNRGSDSENGGFTEKGRKKDAKRGLLRPRWFL